jgi:glucan phosphoethanolaminetransferase (alkaline phosphatase superfamily)
MSVPDLHRKPARHPVPILLPCAVVGLLAITIATWLHNAMLLEVSLCVSYIGTSALVAAVVKHTTLRTFCVGMLGFAFAVLWLLFYAALLFTLTYLGELPTRHILVGYAPELRELFSAAPLTALSKSLLLTVTGLVLALVGAGSAYCFASSTAALRALVTAKGTSIVFRAVFYSSIVFNMFSFAAAQPWHELSREPLLGSWHNISIGTNYTDRQRHPLESGADIVARERSLSQTASRRPNVVLIYVDALRADVTEPYGGPRKNMAFVSDMVAKGVWRQVDHVLAACPATICGLAAILQSRPAWLQSPDNYSLPKLLKDHGYFNAYVLSSNHQNYRDLRRYYDPADFYLDGKDLDQSRGADDRVVMTGLERLGPWRGEPTFLMIGLVSTHALATKAEEFRIYRPDRAGLENRAVIPEAFVNNYHNGVLQADAMLRKIWAFLSEHGYLRDAIVVITSDHGEALGEDGKFGHLTGLHQPELRIPLWIHETFPTVQESRFARQVDIAPTIVAALGLQPPQTWQGIALQEPIKAATSVHFVQSLPHDVAVVDYDGVTAYKLVINRSSTEEKLFEILRDPQESNNILLQAEIQRVSRMRAVAKKALVGRER